MQLIEIFRPIVLYIATNIDRRSILNIFYYPDEKHCVLCWLNARLLFQHKSFSSTQATLSNVLTGNMALLVRIVKCEVWKYLSLLSSVSTSTVHILFCISFKNLWICVLHLQLQTVFEHINVGNVGPSSGHSTKL